MNGSMYYRRDGTPIIDLPSKPACIAWAEEVEGNRRVCQTKFWWGGWLSTVYLGLDHNFRGAPPLIFESMLFGWPYSTDIFGNERFHTCTADLALRRYSTEKEAIAGHSDMVRKYMYPWRTIGWTGVAEWIWEWFKAWEKGHAQKLNAWSLFEENNYPRMTIEEMTDCLKKETERIRSQRDDTKELQ